MPIEFIKGLPRGGKSLYALQRLVDELCEESPRMIVTNLWLRHEHLADVVAKRLKIPRELAKLRVDSLCYYLQPDELKNFYRRRGFGRYLNPKTDFRIEGRASPVPAYNSEFEEWAVFYVLDEIHVVYDINGYRDEGEQVSYYLSQHGKLGEAPFDHILVISQHPEQVSKKFKLLVQKWHSVRNRYMDKVGGFKIGAYFERREYLTEPKLGTTPVDSQKFEFNKEIADCYDTLAGVGVRGRGQPRIAHAKGWPAWSLWAIGAAACLALFLVVSKLPGFVAGAAIKQTTQAADTIGGSVKGAASSHTSAGSGQPAAPAPAKPSGVYPVAVLLYSRAVVYSDGSRQSLPNCGGYALRGDFAIVGGYRVPVEGSPRGALAHAP